MEKVIITKEQEIALERFKDSEKGIEFFVRNRGTWVSKYKSLNDIDPNEFALMYAGVYEVEEFQFKAGDWVFSNTTCKYYEVISDDVWYRPNTLYKSYVNKQIGRLVKVTDDWKLSLLKAGRTSGEFIQGDVIVTIMDVYEVGIDNRSAMEDALSGSIIKFFLKDSAIEALDF